MEDPGKRSQDLLIANHRRGTAKCSSRALAPFQSKKIRPEGISMLRTSLCLAAVLLVAGALHTASAQTTPAPAATPAPSATPAPAAKPSKMKLTAEKLKDMKAKWSANKGKLKTCRAEVKSKGLAGDDRWFYIEDCMGKT
jgi:hypothetical protein